jgi:hypothetical protein
MAKTTAGAPQRIPLKPIKRPLFALSRCNSADVRSDRLLVAPSPYVSNPIDNAMGLQYALTILSAEDANVWAWNN